MSKLNQILRVTNVSEEKTAKDDRHYKVITVVPEGQNDGVISTMSGHKRVIWDQQPMDGDKNHYYNKIQEGSKIKGRIETVATEPYYIESENGRFTHPETGNPANKVNQKTYVLFEDETVDRFLQNDELSRRGEESQEEEQTQEAIETEPADLSEEAEDKVSVG